MAWVLAAEWVDFPWVGLKLLAFLLVPAFFFFWPWFNEVSDYITKQFTESKTGKLTQRIYQTIVVPPEVAPQGDERVIVRGMALEGNDLNDRMLSLQTWLPSTADKAVQSLPQNLPLPLSSTSLSTTDTASFISVTPTMGSRDSSFSARLSSMHLDRDVSKLGASDLPRSITGEFDRSGRSIAPSGRADTDVSKLPDEDVIQMLQTGDLAAHALEKRLGDTLRAVDIRRQFFSRKNGLNFDGIPYADFDYDAVFGACCEVVVGYVPLPLGIVGPMKIDGETLHVPMATTEGTLIASTNRGCKVISMCGGAETSLLDDGITRAPCVQLPSAKQAAGVKAWLEDSGNREQIAAAFNSTTRFGYLKTIKTAVAGRLLYIRFKCFSGDAMGMNMVSKGTDKVLELLMSRFPAMEVVSLSGNFCTDKKPAAVNWIEGRGKSVVAEAVIHDEVVRKVLKTTVAKLVDINTKKNFIGSAMAGSVGGFNAHAANLVAAVFLATGQDPAQVVESANCITYLEPCNNGVDLRISVTMPSIEVGTIGGGTVLGAQGSCLDLLGLKGTGEVPGENSAKLARIIASTVLCGELSLLAALSVGHLVQAHMKYNRSHLNLSAKPASSDA